MRTAILGLVLLASACGSGLGAVEASDSGSDAASAPDAAEVGIDRNPLPTGGTAGAAGQAATGGSLQLETGGSAGALLSTGGSGVTGGNATGGQSTGGFGTGGSSTGGQSTGGLATGGNSTGGHPTGGYATGGYATGGTATGGTATGGFGTGGMPQVRTIASACGGLCLALSDAQCPEPITDCISRCSTQPEACTAGIDALTECTIPLPIRTTNGLACYQCSSPWNDPSTTCQNSKYYPYWVGEACGAMRGNLIMIGCQLFGWSTPGTLP